MSLKTLQMLVSKAANKKNIIMPEWQQGILSPWFFGLVITVGLWVLFIVTIMYSCLDDHLLSDVSMKLFPIYIHIGCFGLVCITVAALSYLLFIKNRFACWFSSFGFLLYILSELIVIVNALTMNVESKLKIYIESIMLFVLLTLYTQMVSWQYRNYIDYQRRLHEAYVDKQISLKRGMKGGCERIPLSGPLKSDVGSKVSNKFSKATPGPSTRRRLAEVLVNPCGIAKELYIFRPVRFVKTIGGHDFKDFTGQVFSKIMANSLGEICSLTGRKNNYELGRSKLIKIIFGVIHQHTRCSNKDFEVTVANWLRHAKQRREREEKKKTQND